MFPRNLPLTPTHIVNITEVIKWCSKSVHLIELSHVTILQKMFFKSNNQILK